MCAGLYGLFYFGTNEFGSTLKINTIFIGQSIFQKLSPATNFGPIIRNGNEQHVYKYTIV